MSEKSFAFASMSVAIVLGVFFYPPPARQEAVPSAVGAPQHPRPAVHQQNAREREIGVD